MSGGIGSYSGRPKAPENRYSIDYDVDSDGAITVTDTVDWYERTTDPDRSADAVAFVRIVLTPG